MQKREWITTSSKRNDHSYAGSFASNRCSHETPFGVGFLCSVVRMGVVEMIVNRRNSSKKNGHLLNRNILFLFKKCNYMIIKNKKMRKNRKNIFMY